jgi:hypothetical protein
MTPGSVTAVWGHVNPHALFRLDTTTRLAIEKTAAAAH